MNIVVLHYHLNHGGVTQVIVNQLRALGGSGPLQGQHRQPHFELLQRHGYFSQRKARAKVSL
jgi:hypothetical protein